MLIQILLLLMLAWSIILAVVVFLKWHSEPEIEQEFESNFDGSIKR